MSRVEAIKRYFSTPEKPVTSRELIDLRKADPKGFDELGDLALLELAKQSSEPAGE